MAFKHADVFGAQTVKVAAQLARRGKEMKFMAPPQESATTSRHSSLIKLVVKRIWRAPDSRMQLTYRLLKSLARKAYQASNSDWFSASVISRPTSLKRSWKDDSRCSLTASA